MATDQEQNALDNSSGENRSKGGPKSNRRLQITENDALIWADFVSGKSVQATCDSLELCKSSVLASRKKMKTFLREDFDINRYRVPLFSLYSLAVKSLVTNLREGNAQVTMRYFESMGILTGDTDWVHTLAKAIRESGTTVVNNVQVGDVDLTARADSERHELRRSIATILGNADRF